MGTLVGNLKPIEDKSKKKINVHCWSKWPIKVRPEEFLYKSESDINSSIARSRNMYYNSIKWEFDNRLDIYSESDYIDFLPNTLLHIYDEIEESKYILQLKDNWDDEGSPSYKKSTWIKTIKFIINLSNSALDKCDLIIPRPKIYHGSNGSIDILWKNEDFRLLINVPEDIESSATFYGDDYDKQKIEGTFNPGKLNSGLLLSLIEL
ncbi:hypothetical protein ES708_09018 [subsurface metagenome]